MWVESTETIFIKEVGSSSLTLNKNWYSCHWLKGKQALQFLIGQLSEATVPLVVGLQSPEFVTVWIKLYLS